MCTSECCAIYATFEGRFARQGLVYLAVKDMIEEFLILSFHSTASLAFERSSTTSTRHNSQVFLLTTTILFISESSTQNGGRLQHDVADHSKWTNPPSPCEDQ